MGRHESFKFDSPVVIERVIDRASLRAVSLDFFSRRQWKSTVASFSAALHPASTVTPCHVTLIDSSTVGRARWISNRTGRRSPRRRRGRREFRAFFIAVECHVANRASLIIVRDKSFTVREECVARHESQLIAGDAVPRSSSSCFLFRELSFSTRVVTARNQLIVGRSSSKFKKRTDHLFRAVEKLCEDLIIAAIENKRARKNISPACVNVCCTLRLVGRSWWNISRRGLLNRNTSNSSRSCGRVKDQFRAKKGDNRRSK